MIRATWARALASVLAMWLAVVTGEPALLHHCEVHQAVAVHQHGQDAMTHGQHSKQHPAHQDCNCLNRCCCAAPVALAAKAPTFTAAITVAVRDSGLPAHEYVAVAAEHILPFQNGPPRTA